MRIHRVSFLSLVVPVAVTCTSLFVAACADDASDTTAAVATIADDTGGAGTSPADTAPINAGRVSDTAPEDTTTTSAAIAGGAGDTMPGGTTASGSRPPGVLGSSVTATDVTASDSSMAAFGPGCSAVPSSGDGSFSGMAQVPAATAASANPVLSTLTKALTAAGLNDTLNGPGPFTVLAPSNDAFAKLDKAALDKLMADPAGQLTKVLTFHVISGQALHASDLVAAGKATTVAGGSITFTGSGNDVTVNGTSKIVCGDIPVANGIVQIVDTVLMPG